MGDENPMSASTGAIKKKRDEKARKRDQRSWENVMRSVTNMSEGAKIVVIQEKYNEIYNELRRTSSTLVAVEKQYAILQKERDHTQTELTKNILAKSKLESLCRELQKHNKVIKDENITRVKEEEEKRREVATTFTDKLNSLTTLMDENKDKSVRLREENISMTSKLTELYDQFQERESHLSNMNNQMDLQKQLYEAQLQKLQVEIDNERKLFDQERQALTSTLEKSEEANRILQANVASMQGHISVYKGQYTEFENTMAKSTKVFDAFKTEMALLQKSNATMEKERNEYLSRWQTCTSSVVQITELHQQTLNDLKVYERKLPLLERVCRQLQAERSAYQRQLHEHSVIPVFVPQIHDDQSEPSQLSSSTPLPPTTISHTTQKKLTKKEKMLVALKSELKVMEDQLKKKVMEKERELTALKSELKLVMEQRKIATRQQEACKGNKEAAMRRQHLEDSITAQLHQIDLLETELEPQPGPSAPSDKPTEPTQIQLKLVKSVPIATLEQKRKSEELVKKTGSSSSVETLLGDLSLDAIPLYKSEAVTDIKEMEDICLVRESEAQTDLLHPAPQGNQLGQGDQPNVCTEEDDISENMSAVTIPLKEVDGKTDLNKES